MIRANGGPVAIGCKLFVSAAAASVVFAAAMAPTALAGQPATLSGFKLAQQAPAQPPQQGGQPAPGPNAGTNAGQQGGATQADPEADDTYPVMPFSEGCRDREKSLELIV